MRYSESDIVEDILGHIRRTGGDISEWRVGIASDEQAPAFRQQAVEGSAAEMIYREAYTTFAAEEVIARLSQGFDLSLATETISAGATTRRPGRIVFVYRSEALSATTLNKSDCRVFQ